MAGHGEKPLRKVRCTRNAAFGSIFVPGVAQSFGEPCKNLFARHPSLLGQSLQHIGAESLFHCAGAICFSVHEQPKNTGPRSILRC